jgi:hypothetical protein
MNENSHEKVRKKTNLYPVTSKFINDEWEKLRRDKIIPWNFLTSGKGFHGQDFYGKVIHYQGGLFEGSPRDVFWGRYIEPFLEDICFRAIDQTIRVCNEKMERLKEPLLETADLLKILVRKTYNLMADIDQRLRGQGYPQTVAKRHVNGEIEEMDRFIDTRVQSEISMHKPPSKSINFYHEHPYLFWSISTLVGLLSLILTIWGILALYR